MKTLYFLFLCFYILNFELVCNFKTLDLISKWTNFDINSDEYLLNPHIIQGSNAIPGQFPWQVSIILDNTNFCGGSLITVSWILTAAHCVINRKMFSIRAGSIYHSEQGQWIQTTKQIQHAGFNSRTFVNDIALLSISKPFQQNYQLSPIKLPDMKTGDLIGQTIRVSGWGKFSDDTNKTSYTLKYIDLPIVQSSICFKTYRYFSSNQLCAAATSQNGSTCNGDSGGAVAIQDEDGLWVQVGIVSFGVIYGCELGYPMGFTRVSSHVDWIQANTGLTFQ